LNYLKIVDEWQMNMQISVPFMTCHTIRGNF